MTTGSNCRLDVRRAKPSRERARNRPVCAHSTRATKHDVTSSELCNLAERLTTLTGNKIGLRFTRPGACDRVRRTENRLSDVNSGGVRFVAVNQKQRYENDDAHQRRNEQRSFSGSEMEKPANRNNIQ